MRCFAFGERVRSFCVFACVSFTCVLVGLKLAWLCVRFIVVVCACVSVHCLRVVVHYIVLLFVLLRVCMRLCVVVRVVVCVRGVCEVCVACVFYSFSRVCVFIVYGVCVLCVHAIVHVYACKCVSGVRFACAFALVGFKCSSVSRRVVCLLIVIVCCWVRFCSNKFVCVFVRARVGVFVCVCLCLFVVCVLCCCGVMLLFCCCCVRACMLLCVRRCCCRCVCARLGQRVLL